MARSKAYLTVRQAADALQVSTKTIYRAVADGRIECRRVGTLIRIPSESIENFGKRRIVTRIR